MTPSNKRIAEYKLVSEYQHHLEDRVRALIASGWQPFGSPFFNAGYIYQAMVRFKEPTK